MLKIVIADDEKFIRKRLMQCIDWDSLGYEVVGEAADGQKLYEIIQSENPDVVITDIKMPVIDGLDVIDKVKRQGYKTEFIVISGYEEFEYAQRSIEIGVFSYVLKPIDKEKLINIIRKLTKKITGTHDLPQMKKKLFKEGKVIDGGVIAMILYYDEVVNTDIVAAITRQCIDTHLSVCYNVDENKKHVILVYKCKGEDEYSLISNMFYDINKNVSNISESAVSIYYSNKIFNEDDLNETVELLRKTEEYRPYIGKRRLEELRTVLRPRKLNITATPDTIEIDLLKYTEEFAFSRIKFMFKELPLPDMNMKMVKSTCLLFTNYLYCALIKNNLSDDNIKTIFREFIEKFETYEFIETMQEAVVNLIDELRNSVLTDDTEGDENYIISQSIKYIEDNIQNDISLREIADSMEISYGYLSRLFNQERYGGFVAQLRQRRIKRAKELLRSSNMKIYEIAYETGFKNAKYFSEVFKKETGVTAVEYRKNKKLK